MRIEKFTVGADPELFIGNVESGEIVSAIGLIPGHKGNPYKPDDMPEGFGLQTDNILAEFNIPPVIGRHDFVHHIEYMKNYIDSYVKKKKSNLGVFCMSSSHVASKHLRSKQAQMIGCDRDLNAYTEEMNPKISQFPDNQRVSGLHIHCGYPNPNIEDSIKLVKYFDMYIGLPSILIDTDLERRRLYGKAGSFRVTPYGLEYRVLGGFMMSTPDNLAFIWDQLEKAINAFNNDLPLISPNTVQAVINCSDQERAKSLIERYKICEFSLV